MRIYIAGPYTKGDTALNVAAAVLAADEVAKLGHVPYIPHLSHFWHMLRAHSYEFWMQQDFEWLKLCDAVLRLPGESSGADQEVAYARENGMAVFESLAQIGKA